MLTVMQADHALGLVVEGFVNQKSGPIRDLFNRTPKRLLPHAITELRKMGFDPNDLLSWISLIVSLIPQYGPILSELLEAIVAALKEKGVLPKTATEAVSSVAAE